MPQLVVLAVFVGHELVARAILDDRAMVEHGDVVAELARRQPVADIRGRLVAGDVDLLSLAARDFHAVLVELLVQGRVKSVRQRLQPVAEVGLTQAVHHALSVVVRRWRRQDFGCWRVELVAAMTRVDCPRRGIMVAQVPWAEPGSRFTRDFEAKIVAYFEHPYTNAVLKGADNVIQNVKRRARGFRNIDYFATMIYLTCGKLDLKAVTTT